MFTESLLLQVQILNNAGVAASASILYGVVRNSEGTVVRTLTLDDVTEVARGLYEYTLDVSDTEIFVGNEVTVFWCTRSEELTPEKAFNRYPIYSPNSYTSTTRLITWCPSYRTKGLYGYTVQRKMPGESSYTEVAKTIYPYWFDDTEYESVEQRKRSLWNVYSLIWMHTRSEPGRGTQMGDITCIETDHKYCEIFGSVRDLIGGHASDTLNFFVHEHDAPQLIGSSYMTRRNEVTAPINSAGLFKIPLIQGALVTVELSDAGIIGKFVVPRVANCPFKEIDFTPIDTHRAQ